MMLNTFKHWRLNWKQALSRENVHSEVPWLEPPLFMVLYYRKATEKLDKHEGHCSISLVIVSIGKVLNTFGLDSKERKNLQVDGLWQYLRIWDTGHTYYLPSHLVKIFILICCLIFLTAFLQGRQQNSFSPYPVCAGQGL